MRHRGNAKNLGLELTHVLTQYLVRHDIVLRVENMNDVSSLQKAGGQIA
jgi:hypothetical protein